MLLRMVLACAASFTLGKVAAQPLNSTNNLEGEFQTLPSVTVDGSTFTGKFDRDTSLSEPAERAINYAYWNAVGKRDVEERIPAGTYYNYHGPLDAEVLSLDILGSAVELSKVWGDVRLALLQVSDVIRSQWSEVQNHELDVDVSQNGEIWMNINWKKSRAELHSFDVGRNLRVTGQYYPAGILDYTTAETIFSETLSHMRWALSNGMIFLPFDFPFTRTVDHLDLKTGIDTSRQWQRIDMQDMIELVRRMTSYYSALGQYHDCGYFIETTDSNGDWWAFMWLNLNQNYVEALQTVGNATTNRTATSNGASRFLEGMNSTAAGHQTGTYNLTKLADDSNGHYNPIDKTFEAS